MIHKHETINVIKGMFGFPLVVLTEEKGAVNNTGCLDELSNTFLVSDLWLLAASNTASSGKEVLYKRYFTSSPIKLVGNLQE